MEVRTTSVIIVSLPDYNNLAGDAVSNKDLTGYSFNIESRGRGHDMFRFNNIDEPFL